jgi:hypothetical protein
MPFIPDWINEFMDFRLEYFTSTLLRFVGNLNVPGDLHFCDF